MLLHFYKINGHNKKMSSFKSNIFQMLLSPTLKFSVNY